MSPPADYLAAVSGTIRQRGPTSWQVRVSLGSRDPATRHYRYVERTVHGGKRDAQRALAALATEVAGGGHRQDRRRTVAELLQRWMEHIESQGRASSTLVRYRSAIKANINPKLGHIDITKLGPADLDSFYAQLLRSGLTSLTVRKSHAILSAALSQALRWGWVDRNSILRVSPPSLRGREIRPPTPGELRCLLEACADEHPDLASLVYVAATTGGRRGELCGLRWNDVDFDTATLTFARSISDAGREVAVKDTKTHQSRRIALDPTTVRVLRDQRALAESRARTSHIDLASSAYVWSQDLDAATPYRPDRVTGAFRSLRDGVGLPHVTFHALRHFAATTLAAQGVGVRTIAGRLGHANPGITLRTYAHFLDAADRDAAAAMGKALDGLHPASAKRRRGSSNGRGDTTTMPPRRT